MFHSSPPPPARVNLPISGGQIHSWPIRGLARAVCSVAPNWNCVGHLESVAQRISGGLLTCFHDTGRSDEPCSVWNVVFLIIIISDVNDKTAIFWGTTGVESFFDFSKRIFPSRSNELSSGFLLVATRGQPWRALGKPSFCYIFFFCPPSDFCVFMAQVRPLFSKKRNIFNKLHFVAWKSFFFLSLSPQNWSIQDIFSRCGQ